MTAAAPPRRVVVTGAAGFIGRAVLAAARARGHHVTALVRRATTPSTDGVATVVADLSTSTDLARTLAGADTVVHCAASLGGDAATQARDTVAATSALVAAMREAGVRRLVLLSSFAVYDAAALPPGACLDEAAPLAADGDARGPYIAAKLRQEAIVRDAGAGLDWRIVRPGLVFGPGRTWFYHLGLHLHPRLWVSLAGSGTLPLTWVDNCADAVITALETERTGVVVNVVDDNLPARADYLAALARQARPTPVVLDVPWGLVRAGARAANAIGVTAGMLHPSRLAGRCQPQTYSNAAAKALGWAPRIPMAEAIARAASGA